MNFLTSHELVEYYELVNFASSNWVLFQMRLKMLAVKTICRRRYFYVINTELFLFISAGNTL